MKNAKGMKNIISHQYGSIDDRVVFDSINEELLGDINKFLNEVRKFK